MMTKFKRENNNSFQNELLALQSKDSCRDSLAQAPTIILTTKDNKWVEGFFIVIV